MLKFTNKITSTMMTVIIMIAMFMSSVHTIVTTTEGEMFEEMMTKVIINKVFSINKKQSVL